VCRFPPLDSSASRSRTFTTLGPLHSQTAADLDEVVRDHPKADPCARLPDLSRATFAPRRSPLFFRAIRPFCKLSPKGEAQGELDLAGEPGGFAEDTEAGAEQGVRRQSEIHNIENVEELRAKLQDSPFGAAAADRSVLDQSDIVLLEFGAAKSIAPERAKVALIGAGPPGRLMGIEKKELLFAPRPK